MSIYLPVALIFAVAFSILCYSAYRKGRSVIVLWGGVFMVVTLRILTSLYPYIWNTDEGEWVSLARTLPYCSVPYKCFDAHSTGFLGILVFKLLDYFGIDYNYSSLRLFGLFVYIIPSIFLFYYTLRRLYTDRTVILGMSVLFHFFLFGSYCYDLFSYHAELPLMLLTAAAYYCYIRYVRGGQLIMLVPAAVAIGLMPFFKLQSAPIVLGFTFLFLLHFFRKRKWAHGLIFCGAGILPLLIIVFSFWQMGVLNDFWIMYIESNQYLVKHFTTTTFIGKIKVFLFQQIWQFPYYLLAGVLLGVAFFRGNLTRDMLRKFDLPALLLLFCSYFAFAASGQGMQHYLTLVVIPFFFVMTSLFSLADAELYFQEKKRQVLYISYLFLTAALLLLIPELKSFSDRRYHARRPDSPNLVAYVQREVPHGEPVSVLGWFDAVEIQVALDRPLATRTAHNYYLLADKDSALMNYYHNQYIADLEESRPKLVIDPCKVIAFTGKQCRELDDPRMEPIRRYLEVKYVRLDTLIDNAVIYKRKNP